MGNKEVEHQYMSNFAVLFDFWNFSDFDASNKILKVLVESDF